MGSNNTGNPTEGMTPDGAVDDEETAFV